MNEKMKEKTERAAEILMTAGFLLMTLCVIVVTILRPKQDTSYFENRSLSTFSGSGDIAGLERALCDNAAFRTTLSGWKAWCDIHLLHRPVVNGVVVTDGTVLFPYEKYEKIDLSSILENSDRMGQDLAALCDSVKEYGGTFLYAAVPSKFAYDADLYPWYLNNREEYNREVTAAFFAALERYEVPYLDIGEVWTKEDGAPRYLSAVDHHYTWDGCFSAYRAVMERLEEDGGRALSVLSEEDLEIRTAPNPFLGSYARMLCRKWRLDEPFRYGVLREEIPFTRYNWENPEPAKAVLFSFPALWWEDLTFTAYMGGDIGETIIKTDRQELPSLLIFGDSYTNGLETLMYASFDEMRSLDLRHREGDILAYIREYQPDYVVCVRDYEQFLNFTGNGRIGS